MSQYGNYQEVLSAQKVLHMLGDTDEFGFLSPQTDSWASHRPMLLLGLQLTTGPVTELGSGESSTPDLIKYCAGSGRAFNSFDSNKEWAEKTGSTFVAHWDSDARWQQKCGLLFVDHAPGEHRWKAIQRMADLSDIIIFHDSEIGGAGNYQYDCIYSLFKYQLHYNRHGGGAGCSTVSNKIDVNVFKGLKLGQYTFDND